MMLKNKIRLFVVFASIALAGLVITQAFWITKSIKIKEEQFNHRADMALEDVLAELVDFVKDTSSDSRYAEFKKAEHPTQILELLDTNLLDTLMVKYISNHKLDDEYYYNIRKSSNKHIIYSKYRTKISKTKSPVHRACLSCIWKSDYYHIALYFPRQRQNIVLAMGGWVMLTIAFLIIVILMVIYIIATIIKQKKISEIKNDFINNMTHEFKTPISTISLTTEMLANPKNVLNQEKIKRYAQVILDENERMRKQVDKVLNAAQMEKEQVHLNKEMFDAHEEIKDAVKNFCTGNSCDKEVDLKFNFELSAQMINADKVHFRNIISNLVENATKYSGDKPHIKISTASDEHNIFIEVADNGIGMTKEQIKNIFDKFYRVPTGNLHDVKGFGLGLYYVKTIVEAHGGDINVSSTPGKGSAFKIRIPINQK